MKILLLSTAFGVLLGAAWQGGAGLGLYLALYL